MTKKQLKDKSTKAGRKSKRTYKKNPRTGKTVSIISPTCPVPVVDSSGNIDITHLSRTAMARAVKVDLAHISRIFSGRRSPSLDLARRIADYMGVSLDKLQAFLDGRQP